MKYSSGQEIRLGDKVKLGNDSGGVVVAVLERQEFEPGYSAADWAYLQRGVLVAFPLHGLIHYEEPESGLELVARIGA